MIPDENIYRILTTSGPEDVCQALINAANDQGRQGNTTVVVAAVGAGRNSPVVAQASASDQDTQEVGVAPAWWNRVVRAILRRRWVPAAAQYIGYNPRQQRCFNESADTKSLTG
jgi:hypothetical protein